MSKDGDDIKKGATHVTVMSALPAAHEFLLKNGKSLTIKGQPQSIFVGGNALPLQGNQFGETEGVKIEDWEYIVDTYRNPKGKDGKRMPEKGLEFLKSGIMFAASTKDEKKAKKKEKKDVKTGLEQLDPTGGHTEPHDKDEDK